jgi:FkbM family methyltransferase
LFSLRPAVRRNASELLEFLIRNKKIFLDRKEKVIYYKNKVFYFGSCEASSVVADLVSVWSSKDEYLKRNFVDNPAFFFEGAYEKAGFKIKEGDIVLDAGASVGLFSILASSEVGSAGMVFAFEPVGESVVLLSKNLSANKINNVRIIEKALGRADGDATFFVSDKLSENSAIFSEPGGESRELPIISLDSFVKKEKIAKIDFLKADIEGMERDLLAGAKETIKKFKPKIAICSYHLQDDKQVLSLLIKEVGSGYKLNYSQTKIFASYENSH